MRIKWDDNEILARNNHLSTFWYECSLVYSLWSMWHKNQATEYCKYPGHLYLLRNSFGYTSALRNLRVIFLTIISYILVTQCIFAHLVYSFHCWRPSATLCGVPNEWLYNQALLLDQLCCRHSFIICEHSETKHR